MHDEVESEVICLQKTKVSSFLDRMAHSIWKIREIVWRELPVDETTDLVVILWNENSLQGAKILIGDCAILYLLENRGNEGGR